ncbi:MAG: tryptophan 7-halogenase [Gammaproteobacteria bacterium]|nr:tryptophan 7-halogenase [Gammaproteobacteria bacterium]
MHPNSPPPKHIVIAGGGSAGWMTASIFLRSLGLAGSKITLIESPNIPTIGVGEGTTPLFKRFLKFLEVPEEEFMGACKATYKHGIEFPGWTGRKEFESYFHPFAAPSYRHFEQQFFSNCDRRRKGELADTDPSNFFFNAELAKQCKAPVSGRGRNTENMDYAYHFDTAFLAEFLKQRCIAGGIEYVVDNITDVVVDANGDLDYLETSSHGTLDGDFFVDCTGFRRMLLSKVMDSEPVSYESRLFNNSAVVIRTPVPEEGDLPPYTESTALRCGWAWRIPLMNKISWGYVYSANYTSPDDAEKELREHIGEDTAGIEPLHIKLQVGRVAEHWKRNCLAVGLSQGFIEPLEATALGLTQFTINRFVTYFSRDGFGATHRAHFNDIINEAFDRTIDYIQMHYKLNSRDDTQYWRDCRANENITATMRTIIEAWEDPSADFMSVLKEEVHRSSYAPYSWYCILSGMGRYSGDPDGQRSDDAANPYRDEVSGYPAHRSYLEGLQIPQRQATG